MSECRIMDWNYVFLDETDITVLSENTNFPADNLKSTLRSKVFRTTGVSNETIVFDLKTAEDIDSFVMMFHPLDGIKLTTGVTVTVQGSATNSWTSPGVSVTASIDWDHEICTYFWSSSQSYRYWRVKIHDPANGLGYIEVGKIILTKATQLSQCPEIGFSYKTDDTSKQYRSEFNQVYTDIKPNVRTFEFNYKVMLQSDFETLQDIYDRVGSVMPICLSLDTQESLFDKDRFIIYGHLDGNLNSKHVVMDYFDTPLVIKEAF